jgi:hypothetical protein
MFAVLAIGVASSRLDDARVRLEASFAGSDRRHHVLTGRSFVPHDFLDEELTLANCAARLRAASATLRASSRIASSVGWTSLGTFCCRR